MSAKYQQSSIINGSAGTLVLNHSEGREHVILQAHSGSQMTLNKVGLTMFSPNISQHHTNGDSFKSVGKDDSTYVKGMKWIRAEKGVNIVVGDTKAITSEAHQEWNKQISEIATVNCQPEVKKPVKPVVPAANIEDVPPINDKVKIEKKSNPAIDTIQNKVQTGQTKNSLGIPNDALSSKKDYGIISKLISKFVGDKIKDIGKLATNVTNQIKDIKNAPATIKKALEPTSPSTDGAKAPQGVSAEDRADVTAKAQKDLIAIESQLGDGGDYVVCASRNVRIVCGAAVNNNPQAYVDLQGRQVPAGVVVTKEGMTTAVAGAPELVEVDNHSFFPCGKFTLEVGNGVNIKTGGGGINLSTCGSLNLQTDTIIKIGALQTVLGGKDIIMAGDTNVSISSPNLNLTSENQIMLNGNVGVERNLLVQGGGYFDGNLTCNSITAPREIQQTLIGFTKEGARGFLRNGEKITGSILIKDIEQGDQNVTKSFEFEITLDQQTSSVMELNPHGHEFPNIPLSLLEGNSGEGESANEAVRGSALAYNSTDGVLAADISNVNKYPKNSQSSGGYGQVNDKDVGYNVSRV